MMTPADSFKLWAGNRGSTRADTSENAPSSKITGQISSKIRGGAYPEMKKDDNDQHSSGGQIERSNLHSNDVVNWVLELWSSLSSLVNAARCIRHTLPARVHAVHEGLQEAWATNMYMLFQFRSAYWQFSSHLDNFNSWMDCFLETQWPLINLKETQHREVIKLLEQEILSDHVKAIKHLQTCSVVPAFLLVPRQEEYFSFEIVCCFFLPGWRDSSHGLSVVFFKSTHGSFE